MTIVNDVLKQMPGLGRPQRKFLATLFVTMLVLRGHVNFRHLSRDCDDSERTIARQFRAPVDWPDFHPRVLMTALDPRSALVSAHDAAFIPKSGQQTVGLGPFFNGCASRAARGLEMSTLAVVEVTRRCAFTLAGAQTPLRPRRKQPGLTSTRSRCVSIDIASRRASPIMAWRATMRRRSPWMQSSASIGMPSPHCGAPPTAYFLTPVHTRSDVEPGAHLMGRGTSRF